MDCGRERQGLEATDVDVAVVDFAAVGLEFDLLHREDGAGTVPVVLERDVVNDEDAVEAHGDAVALHADVEGVPFAEFVIGHAEGRAAVLLVVVESARAYLSADIGAGDVPNLHLWGATQVDASIGFIASGVEAPVDEHLEVGELLDGADVVETSANVGQEAVLHVPVIAHALVGSHLLLGELEGCHQFSLDGIVHEAFPAGEVVPIEMADETLNGFVGEVGIDGFALFAAYEGQGACEQVAREVAIVVGVGEGDGGNSACCLALEGLVVEALRNGGHGHEGARGGHLAEERALLSDVSGLLHLMAQGDKAVLGSDGLRVGAYCAEEHEQEDGMTNEGFHEFISFEGFFIHYSLGIGIAHCSFFIIHYSLGSVHVHYSFFIIHYSLFIRKRIRFRPRIPSGRLRLSVRVHRTTLGRSGG